MLTRTRSGSAGTIMQRMMITLLLFKIAWSRTPQERIVSVYPMVKGGGMVTTPNVFPGWWEQSADGGKTWIANKSWDLPFYLEG
jgi:hypothetical protein